MDWADGVPAGEKLEILHWTHPERDSLNGAQGNRHVDIAGSTDPGGQPHSVLRSCALMVGSFHVRPEAAKRLTPAGTWHPCIMGFRLLFCPWRSWNCNNKYPVMTIFCYSGVIRQMFDRNLLLQLAACRARDGCPADVGHAESTFYLQKAAVILLTASQQAYSA
jgi:hypothetical protein